MSKATQTIFEHFVDVQLNFCTSGERHKRVAMDENARGFSKH